MGEISLRNAVRNGVVGVRPARGAYSLAVVIFVFLSAHSHATISRTYEVYRNTTDATSSAMLIAEGLVNTYYDDTDPSLIKGKIYYYWVKVRTSDVSVVYGVHDDNSRRMNVWLDCPTSAKNGTQSKIKTKVDISEWGTSADVKTISCSLEEDDQSSSESMKYWYLYPYKESPSTPWSSGWETYLIDISVYENLSPAQVYFYATEPFTESSNLTVQTTSVNVNLSASWDPAPSDLAASDGAYDDKIRLTWADASGNSSFSAVNDGYAGKPTLSVSPDSRDVGSDAGFTTFIVSKTGYGTMNWSASESCDMITAIEPASGSFDEATSYPVTVYYKENNGAARSCNITFTAPGANGSPKTVTVNQASNLPPTLSVIPAKRDVDSRAGATTFTVSNIGGGTLNWWAAESCAWVTEVSPGTGTLGALSSASVTVYYTANTGSARSCTITFTASGADGSPKTVVINQAADDVPTLSVVPDKRDVDSSAGSTTFTVSNTGAGTLNWSATESCDMITGISPGSGSLEADESAFVTVYYSANSGAARSCNITFTAPGANGSPKVVAVNQAANTTPMLAVSPVERDVDAKAGSTTVTVTNAGAGTLNWSASESCDMVTGISPGSGSLGAGNSIPVTVYYGENNGAARSCNVTFTAPGADGSPKIVAINQGANTTPTLTVSPILREVDSNDGSTTFTVTNTGAGVLNWSVLESCDMVTGISPETGSLAADASMSVTVYYDANSGGLRSCAITFSASEANGSPQEVTVNQVATTFPTLSVSPNVREVGSASGFTTFTVSNTGAGTLDWSVAESCDMVTSIFPDAGSLAAGDSAPVMVYYNVNNGAARSCAITFSASGANESPLIVAVNQVVNTAPTLSVSPAVRNVESGPGSATFTVSNPGVGTLNWSVVESCDMVTSISPNTGALEPGGSAPVSVYYSANSGAARSCLITFSASGANETPQGVTVNQAANTTPTLYVSPSFRQVASGPGSTTFTVSNPGNGTLNWSASESCALVTSMAPASGSLDAGCRAVVTVYYDVVINGTGLCDITFKAPGANGSPQTVTIKELSPEGEGESVDEGEGEGEVDNVVETPQFSPEPGHYFEPQEVVIICPTPDANIRYTRDGTVPTEYSALYTAPLTINESVTLTAKAWKQDWVSSAVQTGVYVIESEGETPVDGEGEQSTEGEGKDEPEDGTCGCCKPAGKNLDFRGMVDRAFGDWLLIGFGMMLFVAFNGMRKNH